MRKLEQISFILLLLYLDQNIHGTSAKLSNEKFKILTITSEKYVLQGIRNFNRLTAIVKISFTTVHSNTGNFISDIRCGFNFKQCCASWKEILCKYFSMIIYSDVVETLKRKCAIEEFLFQHHHFEQKDSKRSRFKKLNAPHITKVQQNFNVLRRYLNTTSLTTDDMESKMTYMSNREMSEISDILTHVNEDGDIKMIDVGEKEKTRRFSVAIATVRLGKEVFRLVKENSIEKGNVLNVAKLAGIMAAKKTSDLIPLCHNILLSDVAVDFVLDEETWSVVIEGKVKCHGRTGVEMEALTCVSVAALTVYDMCKAVSKDIVICDVRLLEKDGGKSGHYRR